MTSKNPPALEPVEIKAINPTKVFIGKCIYCGSTDDLELEHVIPYFMGGGIELEGGSCKGECKRQTSSVETHLSRSLFAAYRSKYHLQSRSRKKRSKGKSVPEVHHVKIFQTVDGEEIETPVSPAELPDVFSMPIFPLPGLLRGNLETYNAIEIERFILKNISGRKNSPLGKCRMEVPFSPLKLMRLIAKIAHGSMHAALETHPELQGFRPLLKHVIMDGSFAPYFLGSLPPFNLPEPSEGQGNLNCIGFSILDDVNDNQFEYLLTHVQLFIEEPGIVYGAVTGYRPKDRALLMAHKTAFFMPGRDGPGQEPGVSDTIITLISELAEPTLTSHQNEGIDDGSTAETK